MPALPPPIVDSIWIDEHRDRPLVVCEVRSTMASATPPTDVVDRRLHSAVIVSLEDDLSAPAGPVVGRHPLPSPEDFAAALGRLGIDDDVLVLAFDDRDGAFAGRLVWMLRVIGQPAALVDGDAIERAHDLHFDAHHARQPVVRAAAPWPADAFADADEVAAHITGGGVVVDSRDAARYAGEVEPIDAIAGHVPGAINVPFAGNLVDGRFRSTEELAARFDAAGVDGDAIVYCGSGVTACHNALAIERAGLGRPAVYVGSWSGWSTDPIRPVATGATP